MAAATPIETPAVPEAPERTDAQRTRVIRDRIRARSEELRARHPFLQAYQSRIGLGLLLGSLFAMAGVGGLYAAGVIPAWLCVPLVAMACSVAHEIEHDLIHNLYFPRRKKLQDAMFALVWAMRPDSVSPWVRRQLHLHHHKVSGTRGDLEEESISNGQSWGVARLLVVMDGALAMLLHLPRGDRQRAWAKAKLTAKAYFPLGFVHYPLWWSFLGFHAVDLLAAGIGAPVAWPAWVQAAVPALDFLAVVWLAPNTLRSFCIKFVSSNMHYYGDVEKGNVMQQTQVLNRWWLAPLHLFCFNFGSTHAIHHFWVADPFYLRQLTAPVAHHVFRENGVRFNDFDTFRRANRYRPRGLRSGPSARAAPRRPWDTPRSIGARPARAAGAA